MRVLPVHVAPILPPGEGGPTPPHAPIHPDATGVLPLILVAVGADRDKVPVGVDGHGRARPLPDRLAVDVAPALVPGPPRTRRWQRPQQRQQSQQRQQPRQPPSPAAPPRAGRARTPPRAPPPGGRGHPRARPFSFF